MIIDHFEIKHGNSGYHYSTISGDNPFFWIIVDTVMTNSDIWFLAELMESFLGIDSEYLSIEMEAHGSDIRIKFF